MKKLITVLSFFGLLLSGCNGGENTSASYISDPAYQIYLLAVEQGETRTYDEWIEALKGKDGHTPTITIGENGNWFIDGVDSNVKAIGKDGASPDVKIGENGNWFINGVDAGIKAQGAKGADGTSLLNGNGAPTQDLGKDGDSYIDLTTWNYYVKEQGIWNNKGCIKASANDTNPQGLAFFLLDDGTYAVDEGNSVYLSNIVIPSTYLGKSVTELYYFDSWADKDVALTIPNTIRKINGISWTVKKLIYQGTYEQFAKIDFREGWTSKFDIELTCNDATYVIKDLLTQVKFKYNGTFGPFELYPDANIYPSHEYPETGCFVLCSDELNLSYSIPHADVRYHFTNNNVIDLEANNSNYMRVSIKGVGETTLYYSYNGVSDSTTFKVNPLHEFNVVFESKTFINDGQKHWLDPVSGDIPENTEIHYSHIEFDLNDPEDIDNIRYGSRPLSDYYVDFEYTATLYAYLLCRTYKPTMLSATLTVINAANVSYLKLNNKLISMEYDFSSASGYRFWRAQNVSVDAGDIIAFNVGGSDVKLSIGRFNDMNITQTNTAQKYDSLTIKTSGVITIMLIYDESDGGYYPQISYPSGQENLDYSSWSQPGHIYFHYYREDGDYSKWAVWAWQYYPNDSAGSLWGVNPYLGFNSNLTPMSYLHMSKTQCGGTGSEDYVDRNGIVIDVDLTIDIYDSRNHKLAPLINDWSQLNRCSIGFLIVDQTSTTGNQWITAGNKDNHLNGSTLFPDGMNSYAHVFCIDSDMSNIQVSTGTVN